MFSPIHIHFNSGEDDSSVDGVGVGEAERRTQKRVYRQEGKKNRGEGD
jgi:hypothetical protein